MVRKFIQIRVPPAVESPRGAEWAANVAIAIARVFSRRRAVDASATRTPEHAAIVSPSAGGITGTTMRHGSRRNGGSMASTKQSA